MVLLSFPKDNDFSEKYQEKPVFLYSPFTIFARYKIDYSMEEQIWKHIAGMDTPGFFITAEMQRTGNVMPEGLDAFIWKKLELIREGIRSRRFVFQEGEWRIYLTFFPTTEVVDERYALKNKVVSRGYR
jgi:hypothetical protein